MSKLDIKKEYKQLYNPSAKEVTIVEVPAMNFLMIDGTGDPNTAPAYVAAVEALYSLSYTIKFAIKKSDPALDYVVAPLEGLWWTDNMADFSVLNKDIWKWTMMIAQPDYVTKDLFIAAQEQVIAKKGIAAASQVRLETFNEGPAAQIMHIGPYSEEGPAVARIHKFIEENGYALSGKHHEIYLSDPRRAQPEKLKTVIRQPFR